MIAGRRPARASPRPHGSVQPAAGCRGFRERVLHRRNHDRVQEHVLRNLIHTGPCGEDTASVQASWIAEGIPEACWISRWLLVTFAAEAFWSSSWCSMPFGEHRGPPGESGSPRPPWGRRSRMLPASRPGTSTRPDRWTGTAPRLPLWRGEYPSAAKAELFSTREDTKSGCRGPSRRTGPGRAGRGCRRRSWRRAPQGSRRRGHRRCAWSVTS